MRIGFGYDSHRFAAGRRLVLGGLDIPFEKGLDGWSDADVVLHAVMDALLGAAALGDIGGHFPPDDPAYKDVSSLVLLERTKELLRGNGWQIGNIDATIVAEHPRISPHIRAMRQSIARALSIDVGRVSIKATTNEGMGFIGREEGIAACAVSLIEEI